MVITLQCDNSTYKYRCIYYTVSIPTNSIISNNYKQISAFFLLNVVKIPLRNMPSGIQEGRVGFTYRESPEITPKKKPPRRSPLISCYLIGFWQSPLIARYQRLLS